VSSKKVSCFYFFYKKNVFSFERRRFKVKEMSSISTLEVAWENKSLWPRLSRHWSERIFCSQVAKTNKLELLKWAREEKKCKWDKWTIFAAAEQGNLEMVKYCVANECPIDDKTCARAASGGHLECLKLPEILTRRSQSASGFLYCSLGGFKWSSSYTRVSCRAKV